MSGTKDLWNFPSGFADWLDKGRKMLKIIKGFEGSKYEPNVQIKILGKLREQHLTNAQPSAISSRKILNSFAKVGMLNYTNDIYLTKIGEKFLNAKTDKEAMKIIRDSCVDIIFWNPIEENMSRDFDVRPFLIILRLLLELGFLTNEEIGRYVIKIKNNSDVQSVIDKIKRDRINKTKYEKLSIDEKNRAGWMMSLFGSTDLIRRVSGRLILKDEALPMVLSILQPEFGNLSPRIWRTINEEVQKDLEDVADDDLDEVIGTRLKEYSKPISKGKQKFGGERVKRKIGARVYLVRLYDFKCQICGTQIKKVGWKNDMSKKEKWKFLYATGAHIKPIAEFPDLDIPENILCVCPNCHVQMDMKTFKIIEKDGNFYCKNIVDDSSNKIFIKKQHEFKLF